MDIPLDEFDPDYPEDDPEDDSKYPDSSIPDASGGEIPSTPSRTLETHRAEIIQQKIKKLYEYLKVSGDPNLAQLDHFRAIKNRKTGAVMLEVEKVDGSWQRLTKNSGEFLADSTLRQKFGGIAALKSILGLEDTPPRLKRASEAAKKLNSTARELERSLMSPDLEMSEIPPQVDAFEVQLQAASSETGLPVRELLGLDKALQTIKGELENNLAKLSDIDRQLKHKKDKLKVMEMTLNTPMRSEIVYAKK